MSKDKYKKKIKKHENNFYLMRNYQVRKNKMQTLMS